ncbi:MAG TPA: S8 family serine peptidase [Pseudonocardiaceae bacterium]|nr:S8 family serine peptidase [Pseudonocardiaceae bacterium]
MLGCTGSGSWADVIEGIDWVWVNSPGPSVALMALGGVRSPAVDAATSNLVASGVFVAVCGGSSNTDACNFSPAGSPGAYAVIRTTSTDQSASTNNYGSCVKLQAPGTSIPSTWLNNGTNVISGTSMAAAHVTGIAAMFLDAVNDAPSSVVAGWLSGGGDLRRADRRAPALAEPAALHQPHLTLSRTRQPSAQPSGQPLWALDG